MSLLTEKQVKELVTAILDTKGTILWSVKAWNENQPRCPALPLDWDLAPKWAESAVVSVTWCGVDLMDTVELSRTKRPATPHPHAALMVKYAEIAARRVDPWEEFELESNGSWNKCELPISFQTHLKYRHIGETK